jgi:hypothetical protein
MTMRANPFGTPSEVARAHINWRDAGRGPDAARCETCEHLLWPDDDSARKPSPRCAQMPTDPHARRERDRHVATRLRAVCDQYLARPEPTPEQRRTNLRLSLHYARLALADAAVRGDATSERLQVQDLERQMSALTQEHTS